MSAATRAHSDDRGPLLTPIAVEPQRLRRTSWKEYGIRFAFGGIVTAIVGVLGTAFGPSVAGLFLAFPAILVASLTLIQKEEDRAEAREDARGAIAGGAALTVFAVVFTVVIAHGDGGVALAAATGAWVVVALGLYGLLWFR
jgi:uncharacterized membrane protein (GlpM family)